MGHDVSAIELRITLLALEQAAGGHYAVLLQQAGLTQYLAAPPPAADTPGCTAAQYSLLIGAAYVLLGEPYTRRMLRQVGTELVDWALRGPSMQRLMHEGGQLAPERRLVWLVRLQARFIERYWARPILSEDAQAHYIALDLCTTCAQIINATAPICMNVEALYAGLAERLTGQPVQVAEVACAAQGAPHCTFAFYK